MTRREFLATSAVVGGALTMDPMTPALGGAESGPRFPIIGFSKPFQDLSAEETAELVAEVGWDGIECPVRARGQIEPERVTEDLPRFVGVLRRHKLDVLLAATDITSLQSPHAEDVLRTLSRLGIGRLRLGPLNYRPGEWPPDRLKEMAPALRDIAAACGELGLQAGFQNHSGRQSVGAPVWDVFSILRDLDPRQIGFCFDIGHATVEGGLSWPVEARLAEPFLAAVIVKDFFWKKEASDWRAAWCPLGEGMVSRAFFDWLKKTRYRGPICQHHEFELGDNAERLAHFQRDLKVLRDWLA
jgi:sugar phosphate isomerase/epimerase